MSEAPALGYSIVANLGDDRQMTVQCFVASDEPLPEQHAKIDRAMAVVDRQRARYQLADLRKDREKQALVLQRAEDDLARVEADFKASQAAHDNRLVEIAQEIASIDEAAHAAGRGSPKGSDLARRNSLQSTRKEIAEAKNRETAERDQHLGNVAISIERFREAVADCDKRIAECEALLEGG